MKRTEKDVSWSDLGQINKCLWCGENAMAVGPDEFVCFNDPDCLKEQAVAAEAARLEAEIEQRKDALLRTMNI